MRRFLSALTMSLCVGFTAHAQVYIFNENMLKERMSEIKTTVLDSLTNEPVSYASVYVIPAKDTTITNFTLTDATPQSRISPSRTPMVKPSWTKYPSAAMLSTWR